MIEFTGERVVPGQVDPDLWNEHFSRYAFAARLTAGKRVLDAGCGTGYGSAVLAKRALSVTGVDVAPEAVAYAREHYGAQNAQFLEGSCSAMPVADSSFDLVVAFEVIEHLEDWQGFLRETRRVLAPGGALVVSTPNRDTYAEFRRLMGPNPFHTHEFGFDEFQSALQAVFPNVHLYLQNHVAGIAFEACTDGPGQPELLEAGRSPDPREASFFLAVCSLSPLPAPTPFVYHPATGNVLREREIHIGKLEIDVEQLRADKQKMVDLFRVQETELEQAHRWSSDLDSQLAAASARIAELQTEVDGKNRWAQDLGAEVDAKGKELLHCIDLLHAAEKTVEERTAWALGLQEKIDRIAASRWMKLAKFLRIGPKLNGE